jgi:hypothetical protein
MDNESSVKLSEYCFNVCDELKTTIQGKRADELSEPVRIALVDLDRCVGWPWPICFPTKQFQGYLRNRANPQGGGEYTTHGI